MATTPPIKMSYKRFGRTNLDGEEVQIKGYASDFILNHEQLVTKTSDDAVPAKFIINLH